MADMPFLEVVEFDRKRIGDLIEVIAEAQAESLAQKCPNWMRDETNDIVKLDNGALGLRQRGGKKGRRLYTGAAERLCAIQHHSVEAPRRTAPMQAGLEVGWIERLKRMANQDVIACVAF